MNITWFPITLRGEYHVIALNLSMQDGMTKGHAGGTHQTLHLLRMQSAFDELVVTTRDKPSD